MISIEFVLLGYLTSTILAFSIPHTTASFKTSPAAFQLNVDQSFIDDVYTRVQNARAPIALSEDDDDGAPLDEYNWIRDHWLESYDWKATEASINSR